MKLPTPDRDDIVQWVHNAYNKISEESIRKTFRSIGYKCCEFEENDAIDFEYIIENEEEEGTIDTKDLFLNVPDFDY